MPTPHHHLRRARLHLGLFIHGLTLSGLTAFPIQLELDHLARLLRIENFNPALGLAPSPR